MLNVNCIQIHSVILCHLSQLEKLSPPHTHPIVSIHEFSKGVGGSHRGGAGHAGVMWDGNAVKQLTKWWLMPPLHDPAHPTPSWPSPAHPTPTWPTPPLPNPPLHDLPHLFMTHHTPPLHDPPHPFMTHPTPPYLTPPLEQFWEEMGWIHRCFWLKRAIFVTIPQSQTKQIG